MRSETQRGYVTGPSALSIPLEPPAHSSFKPIVVSTPYSTFQKKEVSFHMAETAWSAPFVYMMVAYQCVSMSHGSMGQQCKCRWQCMLPIGTPRGASQLPSISWPLCSRYVNLTSSYVYNTESDCGVLHCTMMLSLTRYLHRLAVPLSRSQRTHQADDHTLSPSVEIWGPPHKGKFSRLGKPRRPSAQPAAGI